MDQIPEPHQLADAYYARLEKRYEKSIEGKTCGDCGWCKDAPEAWSAIPHGWCDECKEFVELDQPVKGYCDNFCPF